MNRILSRLVGCACLLLLCPSCRTESSVRYEDLVIGGLLGETAGVEAAQERLCGDETRYATALDPGTEVELPLALGENPRLEMAACRPSAPIATPQGAASADRPLGSLHLVVRGTDGPSRELRLPVTGDGWTRTALDLSALAGSTATLRLLVDVSGDGDVLVSDLWVRHLVKDEVAEDRNGFRESEGARILLVSVDTLRADVLAKPPDSAGSGAPVVPALTALAESAQSFSRHYAAASWTKPSHGTLLTGLPVEAHGAQLFDQALSPDVTTLAQRFSGAGFRTMGLASDTKWLDSKFGFDRGFDDYRLVPWDEDQAVRFTVSWIARHRRDTFFYFLHLFAPHSDKKLLPYEASGVSQRTVAERFGLEDYGCRRRKCASGLLRSINAGDLKPLPGENEVLRFLYARGVETLDRALDRLFTDLDELGLLDRMLVVVTSDHGEAFFEHGRLLHSTVHEEILRVPLLVRWPGGEKAGEVRNDPTSSIDVAPTLLRAAGLPTDRLPGRPLQELPRTGGDQREVFAGTTHKAVVAGPWKAIFSVTGDPPLLYGLDRDPAERHDLSGENPEVLARLRERMIAHIEAARQLAESQEPPDSVSLTPDERRRLEALGYLD